MERSLGRTILSATIVITYLTACAGSGSGVPNTASSLATTQSGFGQEVSSLTLSGLYIGKFHDTIHGASRVKIIFSQAQNALGGVALSNGSKAIVEIIAWNVNGNKISGNGIGPPPSGSGICSFSMTATRKFRRINGSYSATYGCSGQTGTFALFHKCYIPGTGSEAIRPEIHVKPC